MRGYGTDQALLRYRIEGHKRASADRGDWVRAGRFASDGQRLPAVHREQLETASRRWKRPVLVDGIVEAIDGRVDFVADITQ